MKRLPANSRRRTSDVDLCPASPMIVLAGSPRPLFLPVAGSSKGELSWGSNGPAIEPGEGQMGNVGCRMHTQSGS
jgi:hypothetical protein